MAGVPKGKITDAIEGRQRALLEKREQHRREIDKIDEALGQLEVVKAEIFELTEEQENE